MACRCRFIPRSVLLAMIVVCVPSLFTEGVQSAVVPAGTSMGQGTLSCELVSSVRHHRADPTDDVIRRAVEEALYDLDARANADIRVVVRKGTVWLTGSVPTWRGNDARMHATRSVIGVRSIINSLRVVPPSDVARL